MQIKLFIITDRATQFYVGAISLTAGDSPIEKLIVESALLNECGLDREGSYKCFMFNLNNGNGRYDYDKWDTNTFGRTYQIAHKYIEKNWDTLSTGDMISVQAIAGEIDGPETYSFQEFLMSRKFDE